MYTETLKAYKQVVTNAYLQKRKEAREGWLIRPTRAKIRLRCIDLTEHGLENRDHFALRDFLELSPGDMDYLKAFKRMDPEDFRAVENFLNDTEIGTNEKNVELLAWLIGFEPRPFSAFKDQGELEQFKAKEEKGIVKGQISKTHLEPDKTNSQGAPHPPPDRAPKWSFFAAAILLLGAIIIWIISKPDCMYWSNDHYVATSCSIPRLDTPLLPLDQAKLRGFRRIKRVDTLTNYSVGRFWYAHIADSMEVYTGGGNHPLYADKPLKKVTDYTVIMCHKQRR